MGKRDVQAAMYAQVKEKDFQRDVVTAAKMLGWTVFSTFRSDHSPKGEPDLRMVHPQKRRIIWAELKSEDGKLTPDQELAIGVICGAGGEVYVWRPSDMDFIIGVLS